MEARYGLKIILLVKVQHLHLACPWIISHHHSIGCDCFTIIQIWFVILVLRFLISYGTDEKINSSVKCSLFIPATTCRHPYWDEAYCCYNSVWLSCLHVRSLEESQTSFYQLGIIDRESDCAKTILNNYWIFIYRNSSALSLLKWVYLIPCSLFDANGV